MGPWRCLAKVAISLGLEKFLTGFGEPKGVRGVWSTIPVLDLFGIGALGWVQPWKEWAYDSTLRHDSSLGLTHHPFAPFAFLGALCNLLDAVSTAKKDPPPMGRKAGSCLWIREKTPAFGTFWNYAST